MTSTTTIVTKFAQVFNNVKTVENDDNVQVDFRNLFEEFFRDYMVI